MESRRPVESCWKRPDLNLNAQKSAKSAFFHSAVLAASIIALPSCIATAGSADRTVAGPTIVFPPEAASKPSVKRDNRLCGEPFVLLESRELLRQGSVVDSGRLLDKSVALVVRSIDSDGVELSDVVLGEDIRPKSCDGKNPCMRMAYGESRTVGEAAIKGTLTLERGPGEHPYLIYRKTVSVPCQK